MFFVVFLLFGFRAIPENKTYMLFRGGQFVSLKKNQLVFMIPFYDRLKEYPKDYIELKIPQKMIIASDREKVYLSGSVVIKIKDPAKAYTNVDDFQASVVNVVAEIGEEKVKKTTCTEIKKSKKDFDEDLLKKVRYRAEMWGLEIKKLRVNVDR